MSFALRFLMAREPHAISAMLGIVYRAIAGYLIHQAGFTGDIAQTGAVTLIQRFSSALNLNIHFHMLFVSVWPRHLAFEHPEVQISRAAIWL